MGPSSRPKKETKANYALFCRLFIFTFVLTAVAFCWSVATRDQPYLIVASDTSTVKTVTYKEPSDKQNLIDVLIDSLGRLDISDEKLEELQLILAGMSIELCDRYGFELVYILRTDPDVKHAFEQGSLSAKDLVYGEYKRSQTSGTTFRQKAWSRIQRKAKDMKSVPSSIGESASNFGKQFSSAKGNPSIQSRELSAKEPPLLDSSHNSNILLTTYFVTQRDPNHPEAPMNLSMPAIDDFLETTKPFFNKMDVVIFIDFDNPPKDTGIEFIFTDWKGVPYSINDYRYFLYLDYLRTHQSYDMILIVDLKDIKYGRDPWEYMQHSDKNIFIGSEPKIDINWMKRRQRKCWGKGNDSGPPEVVKVMEKIRNRRKKEYIMTNAGILGGKALEIIPIVEEMVAIFNGTDQIYRCNSNMVVFAAIIYPRWVDGRVEWGQPLHSPFREFLPVSADYVFFHK